MTDPFFYIKFMFFANVVTLPLYLIVTNSSVVDKFVRTVIIFIFAAWQVYILIANNQV